LLPLHRTILTIALRTATGIFGQRSIISLKSWSFSSAKIKQILGEKIRKSKPTLSVQSEQSVTLLIRVIRGFWR